MDPRVSEAAFAERLEQMTREHLRAMLPGIRNESRRIPYAYFSDKSLLVGRPLRILHPGLHFWHLWTAKLNEPFLRRRDRRLIKRLVPLRRRQYAPAEIAQIKYSLHFQLALGSEILVVFTNEGDFLERHLGSENVSVIKDHSIVESKVLYEPSEPPRVSSVTLRGEVNDLYEAYRNIHREADVHRLHYDGYSFKKRRVRNLKERFGDFLYTLQSGRCALTGDRLDGRDWEVDHAWPRSHRGNNTLINLQAVLRSANREKSDKLCDTRHSLGSATLRRHGLLTDYHRRLTDRARIVPRLGEQPLSYNDLLEYG